MPLAIPLAVFVAALAALLILLATAVLAQWVVNWVPNWHIIGLGNIRTAAKAAVESAVGTLNNWLDDLVKPLYYVTVYPIVAVSNVLTGFKNFSITATNKIAWMITAYVPAEISAAKSWALSEVRAAEAYALALYLDARAYAVTLYDDAIHEAEYLYNRSIAYSVGLYEKAVSYTNAIEKDLAAEITKVEAAAIATAEKYASGLYNASIGYTNQAVKEIQASVGAVSATVAGAEAAAIKAAESVATGAVTAVSGYVDVQAANAASAVWGDVTDAVSGAIGAAGTADVDIVNALKGISVSVPTTLEGTLAGVLGLSIAATRYLEDCGIPNCRNLSEAGKFLQDLLSATEAGALLAMLVEIVHDPEQAAEDLVSDLGGLVSDTQSLVTGLLGV